MKVIITDGQGRRNNEPSPPIIPSRCGTPCYIEIVTPPDKLVYHNGEAIDTTGMKVVAYNCDGEEWGEIPNERLTIDPEIVVVSGIWTDGDGVNCLKITYEHIVNSAFDGWGYPHQLGTHPTLGFPTSLGCETGTETYNQGTATLYVTNYGNYTFAKRIDGNNRMVNQLSYHVGQTEWGAKDGWFWSGASSSRTTNVFVNTVWYLEDVPTSTKDPNLAGELYPESSGDIITVSWEYDESHIFTDTFQITIE